MIDYASIRNTIVKNLRLYLLPAYPYIDVFPQEEKQPKPKAGNEIKYPFVCYKFTSPYIPQEGQDNIMTELIASSDPNFEYDIKQTRGELPTMTLSLTTYSLDSEEAVELALKCQEWFSFAGDDTLETESITVVETTAIQDRRTLIIDDYEQRQGFDVILRVSSEVVRILPTIETAEINSP